MKKKISLIIVIILIAITIFILWNNMTTSTITLDINPSIKININRHQKVNNIIALNDDGKEIISNKYKNKSLDEVIKDIVNNTIDKNYIERDQCYILLTYNGNINIEELKGNIEKYYTERRIYSEIIIIDNITKEDRKLAKKYGISNSKAAYINMIIKNNNIDINNLVNRTITELKETKDTGRYCESDYKLEGDFCYKAIGSEPTSRGPVCPENYTDINGICYLGKGYTEGNEMVCPEGFAEENNECLKTEVINAIGNYSCPQGKLIKRGEAYREYRDSGDPEEMTCADESTAQKPTSRCLSQEHIIVDGRCGMGPKPLLPTETGCTPEDTNVNGACYDFNNNEWVCPSSGIYETNDMICPETVTYTKAIIESYRCEDDYTLDGDKCIKTEKVPKERIKLCPEGYTLVNNNWCINKNETADFIEGDVCEKPDTRIENNKCIIFDIIEAKK